jgi:tRNA modification GTPase
MQMLDVDDTIAAIAVPLAGGARGVVRVSGAQAIDIAERCFTTTDGRRLRDVGQSSVLPGIVQISLSDRVGTRLPCDAYLWPGAASYTRQPTVELHTLGSPPLLQAALRALCENGARLAEPGEFTLRAFLAGRLDLTQAEAVLGVIDARGENALKMALRQLAGGMADPLAALRSSLIELLANLEAGLDFAEEDIEFVHRDEMLRRIESATEEIDLLIERLAERGEVGALPRVVLVGPPNSGKSSLFNALVKRWGATAPHEALVSEYAGTTRDYLVACLKIDGVEFDLVDTAGDEYSPAPAGISALAQEMSHDERGRADLRLHCVDGTCPLLDDLSTDPTGITIVTKSDLHLRTEQSGFTTSVVTGEGLDQLAAELRRRAMLLMAEERSGLVAATNARCGASLRSAYDSLHRLRDVVTDAAGDELAAAELRDVLYHLGLVVGAVYTDDILDQIFSRFCIGK